MQTLRSKLIKKMTIEALAERFRQEGRNQVLIELLKKNITCVGMSEDFIKGANWCNHLWKKKIKEQLEK